MKVEFNLHSLRKYYVGDTVFAINIRVTLYIFLIKPEKQFSKGRGKTMHGREGYFF